MSLASLTPSGQPIGGNGPPILRLSNELLRHSLDFVVADSEEDVQIDRRQFLSVESIILPPPAHDSAQSVGHFRRACKRFADIGAPLLFSRVTARFSKAGLERIETLAGWPHLAYHVRKLSYMVPCFYVVHVEEARLLMQGTRIGQVDNNARLLATKLKEQKEIVDSQDDTRVLIKAITKFTSLQLVQLLRVMDREDRHLAAYNRQNEGTSYFDQDWSRACSHASRTLGLALLASSLPSLRISLPMLSAQSVGLLATVPPSSIDRLVSRLTCLTIHFDDCTVNLDQTISDLSPLFRKVFEATPNMQAVHVGFPTCRPISLPLESVFHNVTWGRLVAFGIQGWKLEADEIIRLATRYKDRLKGLRLRDVHIKEGGMWKDVLEALRARMQRLEWVSLRRIGYAKHLDTSRLFMMEREVLEADETNDSTSELEFSMAEHSDSEESDDSDEEAPMPSIAIDDSWEDNEDSHSDAESEDGPANNGVDFPALDSLTTPDARAVRQDIGESKDELPEVERLSDDGVSVSTAKRKAWEKWVVRRYSIHDEH